MTRIYVRTPVPWSETLRYVLSRNRPPHCFFKLRLLPSLGSFSQVPSVC